MIKCSHVNGGKKVMTCLKKKLGYALAESQDELLIMTQPIHIVHQKIKPIKTCSGSLQEKCYVTPHHRRAWTHAE
jgi:hypothetical protein